ncbi:MAG: hypothetical protein ABIZ70_09025 [Gemmatimonadales bacterium]
MRINIWNAFAFVAISVHSVPLAAQRAPRLVSAGGELVAIDLKRVPRGEWSFGSQMRAADGAEQVGGLSEKLTVFDTLVGTRVLLGYRVVSTSTRGSVGGTFGLMDARDGRLLIEEYQGPDGSTRLVGDSTFRRATDDVAMDQAAVTDSQLWLLLAGLPMQAAEAMQVTLRRLSPRASSSDLATITLARGTTPQGAHPVWVAELRSGETHTTVMFEAEGHAIVRRELAMFDGGALILTRN